MGNKIFSKKSRSSSANVILPDGTIHHYHDKTMTVAELMLEHPQKVVVEFQPAAAIHKIRAANSSPLPADNKLEMNKVYLMLPINKRGKPAALSSLEARRLLLTANSFFKSNQTLMLSYTGFVPLFARMCTAFNGQLAVLEFKRERRMEEEEEEEDEKGLKEVGNTLLELEGRAEFVKKWKPTLDTIKEKSNSGVR